MILKATKNIQFEIDDEDYELIKNFKFFYVSNGTGQFYIRIGINNKVIGLHRYLLNVTDRTLYVDHIDGNTLNNRRSNLRIVSSKQSQHNTAGKKRKNATSKYKGVRYRKGRKLNKMWTACISDGGKFIFIGDYLTEIEAAKAYNEKALTIFGQYARLNKIEE